MASIDDVVTVLKISNQNMSQLIQTLQSILPRVIGTVTLSAASSTVVANISVTANSAITLMPTSTSAATLSGSTASPYVSALNPGVGFTISTASGASAAGTETFQYQITNPV